MKDGHLLRQDRVILDLCGGTGSWSEPYRKAGYDVRIIDPKINGEDVRLMEAGGHVHGVLAAPPCTDFAVSGAQYWEKTLLWGRFALPRKSPVAPIRVCSQGSWIQRLGGKSEKTKTLRSATPPGFARAFFEANP